MTHENELHASGNRSLQLDLGLGTLAGKKPTNEDAAIVHWPEDQHRREYLGAVAAVADGVSSAEAGAHASATATRQFVSDYFNAPDTWPVARAGEKALTSINSKLYRLSHAFTQQEKGYLCTFSALVIKSRTAHYFHVGDSRIYHLRNGELRQVSRDHTVVLGHQRQMLVRALGMDHALQVDYGQIPLETGDLLLLTSDGVHDFLPVETLHEILSRPQTSAQEKVDALIQQALLAGSDDNVSAVVVGVDALPATTLDEYSRKITRLPFPPPLEPGMVLDGFRIERELYSSPRSQLYLVHDTASGEQVVMKTPSENYADDISYIDRFVQEEWVGLRIRHPNVTRIYRQRRPRTALYYVMEYVDGETLAQWMQNHRFPKPARAFQLLKEIAAGLQAFHDQETVHQDLRPANIMVDRDGHVKIVDFGSVYVAGSAEIFRPLQHPGALGTASYSDPHTLLGRNTGIRGDLYAFATIAYELFTGELPYGEEIDDCHALGDYERLRYRDARQFNPVIPIWFDRTLERGCAIDLERRYHTLDEFMADLANPNPAYLRDDPADLHSQHASLFWKLLCGLWAVTLLALLALFSSV
ncbi:bifunctional protein-serine/threonine kinase/phosphatase [Microbulbifer hainanensis]|uniref:bifunctional protein-serine/threonine kinase/phosphatase n=1 Tax=Microbulbifer hainanensis TaxID=2735675 RepID=UPI0018669A0D|nr:bifunctional protein-serine/threonine kinase/phosphatase [Microbulbifer hainanensis]